MSPLPALDWGAPLSPARFLRRPNRFVVHAAMERSPAATTEVVAHLPDPGRLRELLVPGARKGLRPEPPSPTRKTRWTAMLVRDPADQAWVSVNTTLPNLLVRKALGDGVLSELAGWRLVRHEVPWGESRIDFLMENDAGRRLYLEAKSVTLVEDGVALFSDALARAEAAGVRVLGRRCSVTWEGIELGERVPAGAG